MSKHLNPLEKEFLIRQYKSNPQLKMQVQSGKIQKYAILNQTHLEKYA